MEVEWKRVTFFWETDPSQETPAKAGKLRASRIVDQIGRLIKWYRRSGGW
jgi:hypothetical protein